MKYLKTYLFITAALCSSVQLSKAQEGGVEALITETIPDCSGIEYNLSRLIPEFYNSGKLDSALILSEYWLENCGESKIINTTKNLLLFELNSNYTFQLEEVLKQDYYDDYYGRRNYNYGYNQAVLARYSKLEEFNQKLVRKFLERTDLSTYDRLVFESLNHNRKPLLNALEKGELTDTPIQNEFDSIVNEQNRKTQFHAALLSGVWVPMDNAKLLGTHPTIGFKVGLKRNKFLFDAVFSFRVGPSGNMYQVVQNDSLVSTDYFLGGYIGGEFGYELFKTRHSELDVVVGLAYDGFDAIKSDPDDDTKYVGFDSFNFNYGLAYRFYYNHFSYLGLDGKYNLVNYKNVGGTNLAGNTVSVTVSWGFTGASTSPYIFKQLGF